MQVTIFHNTTRDIHGRNEGSWMDESYEGKPLGPSYAESTFTPVHAYQVADGQDPSAVLEQAFKVFNIGESGEAVEYRARRNRSLSVGDLVQVGDTFHACRSCGWEAVPTPSEGQVNFPTLWGTTPLGQPVLDTGAISAADDAYCAKYGRVLV